jgi:hypothetical protein
MNNKFVRRDRQKCPNCGKVGEIVDCLSSNKYLEITRKCTNRECDRGKEEGEYHDDMPWNEFIPIAKLEKYKERLDEILKPLRKKLE